MIRGKFKLPLYSNTDLENNTYLFIRVALPNDDELTSEAPIIVNDVVVKIDLLIYNL